MIDGSGEYKSMISYERMVKNKKPKRRKVVFALGWLFFIFLAVLVAYKLAFLNKVSPGVFLGGVKVGGLTKEEATNVAVKEKDGLPKSFSFFFEGKTWNWNLADLGVVVDINDSAKRAYEVGRSGAWIKQIGEQKQAWFFGVQTPLVWHWNEKRVDDYISSLSAELERIPEEPTVFVVKGAVSVNPGRDGVVLDVEGLKTEIKQKLDFPTLFPNNPILLPLVPVTIQLSPAEQAVAKKEAESFLGSKISLSFSDGGADQEWSLSEDDLVGFLNLTPPDGDASYPRVASYAATLASAIDRGPENAAFRFTPSEASGSGRVTIFRPGKDGLVLDQGKTIEELSQAVREIVKGGQKTQKISLTIAHTPPQISTASINNLGINELLGRGISYFAGSIPGRIHNVELASSRINGVLVPPGEVFSFNKEIGDISAATGYQPAYIIKEGRTVLGDGGGVCQVSTTLFRAVLNAGLPVEERWAHAYRVHYYEENSQLGLDATVFSPSVDFKFRNDTQKYILVQTMMDKKALKLTFEIYGTSDRRQTTIGKSRVWDVTPPPPASYQDDPTLPAGAVKQVDFSAWGSKASFDWTVTRGTEVLQKRTFYSSYRPWRAVFLRGTKQ